MCPLRADRNEWLANWSPRHGAGLSHSASSNQTRTNTHAMSTPPLCSISLLDPCCYRFDSGVHIEALILVEEFDLLAEAGFTRLIVE